MPNFGVGSLRRGILLSAWNFGVGSSTWSSAWDGLWNNAGRPSLCKSLLRDCGVVSNLCDWRFGVGFGVEFGVGFGVGFGVELGVDVSVWDLTRICEERLQDSLRGWGVRVWCWMNQERIG